jgi:hypothetical protein
VNFTEGFLKEMAETYNPKNYQVPLIITHDTQGNKRSLS